MVAALASRLVVMRDGKVVEAGPAAEVFKAIRRSDYTRALFAAAFNLETAPEGVWRSSACAMARSHPGRVDGPQAGEWLRAAARSNAGRTPGAWLWPDAIGDARRHRLSPASGCRRPACWRGFRNLKAIINLGAGVDRLLADPTLPDVPIARVAHADLTMRVTEYVVLHVLMHHRRQRLYDAQQRERLWQRARPAGGERGRRSASWASA